MLFSLLALALPLLPTALSLSLPDKRGEIDICAFVDVELIIDGIDFGIFRECVCLNIIDSIMDSNAVAQKAARKTSTGQVKNTIANTVTDSGGASQCIYPPHANPVCTETDPCAYTCIAPYAKRGGKCVLGASRRASKRDLPACASGLTQCGVWSHWGSRSYECLDTSVELESCGGCAIPYGDETPTGTDCTQIQGVSDVLCQEGRCVVLRCRPGWQVQEDGCVRSRPMAADVELAKSTLEEKQDNHTNSAARPGSSSLRNQNPLHMVADLLQSVAY
ncbi:hypothetical protein DACRYDRAFT_19363 [Dacryopinax primogenitus]|uniref:Protein CPL1-like domain-containing protein n=1 Tax=Dacryopinax primogenitus (strain DJM 731) TaxID=1858805 RepID=M5G716_DACPD|nr:uncharacterized protein DACRYDRAFT_19363 [Dacryopinax primogenitus]EJU06036.1 hypothetical protein DACRYDRAFT_19363 [Dacryopinax primogenitus]